jgi:predicted outer membrane repeat protein
MKDRVRFTKNFAFGLGGAFLISEFVVSFTFCLGPSMETTIRTESVSPRISLIIYTCSSLAVASS